MSNQISKNCYKGSLINSLDEIIKCADNNESLFHDCWGRKPAKVFCMMQFQSLVNAIKNKNLYRVVNLNKII